MIDRTRFEWLLWFLYLESWSDALRRARQEREHDAWLAECEKHKDGWIS